MVYFAWGAIAFFWIVLAANGASLSAQLFFLLTSAFVVFIATRQKTSRQQPVRPPVPFLPASFTAPTKSGFRPVYLLWALLLIALLLIGETSNSWLVGWLFYVLAVLVLLAFLLTLRPARLLSVKRSISATHCEIGRPVTVQVALSWARPGIPGWLLAQDNLSPVFRALNPCGRMFITGRETSASFTYQATGHKRGYFSIGPLKISCGDLFGLDQVTTHGEDAAYLTIYPKIYPIPPVRLSSNRPVGEAHSGKRIFEDPSRIVGIRDYQQGDTLGKIHWKTTARTGKLATKLCEPSSSNEVNIILNLYSGDYPVGDIEIELACTTAASLVAGLIAEKQIVGFQSNGVDPAGQQQAQSRLPQVKAEKGPQQFTAIMNLLGRLELTGEPTLANYLMQVHSTLPWTATMLVVTHFLSDESAVALEGLKIAGFELAVVLVGNGPYVDASAARAAALNIPLALIPLEKNIANLEFWRPG